MAETVPELITEAAGRFPEREAIRHGTGAISSRQLEAQVAGFAARTGALGIAKQRVGLLLPNLPGFPAALYGLLRAGASTVLLNPLYSRREVGEYLADCGVRTVVTVNALQQLIPEGTRRLLIDGPIASEDTGDTDAAKQDDDEAVVIYTSAVAGWARGARLSHGNLIANAESAVEAMQLVPEDRVLAALPWSHAFGLTVTLNAPLAVGAAVIPVDRFNPLRVLELFESEQPTVFCGVPAMYLALLTAAERRRMPRHKLRVAICGGAPLPVAVAHRWEEVFGLPLREGYGLTEAAPVCLFNRVDRPNHPGTMGVPFPRVQVSVRDTTGEPVANGEVGELC
ncbi:MAG: Long-chain-fatty-acid--CoA ligase, partial [uncultured Gemmatimonadetes bacterium]